jgi:hypothetical protein
MIKFCTGLPVRPAPAGFPEKPVQTALIIFWQLPGIIRPFKNQPE